MGTINLSWTPQINGNVISQRVSKRIKTVGGAFSTIGFTPANDMGTGVSAASTTVTDNKVYEFQLQNICTTGGPTGSVQGIREGIIFVCINPQFDVDGNNITVDVALINTDITKVRYTLKKASDNTIVGGPIIVNRVANGAPHTFGGLSDTTNYYLEYDLYASINGVDAISSSVGYLGVKCGGNVAGYQVTSGIGACAEILIQNSTGGPIDFHYNDCSTGEARTITLGTGEDSTICAKQGSVVSDPLGGTIQENSPNCTYLRVFNAAIPADNMSINSVTGVFYIVYNGAFPVDGEELVEAIHAGTGGPITVNVSNPANHTGMNLKLWKNGVVQQCLNIGNGTANYIFSAVTFNVGDSMYVILSDEGAC